MTIWALALLTLCCVLWPVVAVTAHPSPSPRSSVKNTERSTRHEPEIDVLWKEYGLNKSAEFKYFHEPGTDDLLGHYDSRFFTEVVPDEERSRTLTLMMRAYLQFFEQNALETWIAHGTLLGWWWNGKILPWDWDIDTQVADTTLFRLADTYNQTVVEYTPNDQNKTTNHSYLLDINPWSRQRDRGMGLNIIDARWIDLHTGLYIDITGVSKEASTGMWKDKNGHQYHIDDIYPLRTTSFEGGSARVPFRYEQVLVEEYGNTALTKTRFHGHTWDARAKEWTREADD